MNEQETNKAALAALMTAVDQGDLELMLSFYSPHYVDHDASESRAVGVSQFDALRPAFSQFLGAFAEVKHELGDVIAERDRVAARIVVTARHTGSVFGIPPSHQLVRNDSIVIYRFEHGRIRERWCRERRSTRAVIEEAAARPDRS